mmetsp:Transcript_32309/g.84545  ORF Transcript_32309/g.84545 Transcript_32309/m.84545 type:complete len:149 (+) Transcript_32309:587-1033(+)
MWVIPRAGWPSVECVATMLARLPPHIVSHALLTALWVRQVRKSDGTEGFVPAAFLAEVAPDGMLVIKEEAPASADDIAQMAAFTKVLMMAPAEFDFEGEAEIELTVVAGDMLEVLHLEDLTGNDEWCLVQNDKGHRGFVPKSFVALPA